MECRPFSVEHLVSVTGFSFPSGHAQVGSAFWGFLMWRSKHLWQKLLLFSVILLIALSRPYLGVHYLHDIGIGLLIGLSLSWVFHRWGKSLLNNVHKTMVLLLVSFALSFLNPEESFKIFGALSGLIAGWQVSIRVKVPPYLQGMQRSLSLLYSAIGVLVFWWGLKLLFLELSLDSPFLAMGRYFFLCLWIFFVSPYLASKSSRRKIQT
jgi:hypothetical protein